ncbi:MAG TPA: multicopper oxidase family protein [Hyphomicrobiaceae bacterium]|nr:multicopper oxidase family protein [Hyphomicrobiaceae bacterium]
MLGRDSRRSFLKMVGCAGLGAVSVLPPPALFARFVAAQSRRADAAPQPLIQPQEIRSENGLLRATIMAEPGRVQLGNTAFPGMLYNGAYLPPLLRPRLGDTMRITFRNALPSGRPDLPLCGSALSDNTSNMHFHGMAVSPRGSSDNVFICVEPGQEFEYEVHIPAEGRQRPGLFWYHPHAHRAVAKQILGGMSGGLVVDGFEDLFPFTKDLPERFFLIKHAELPGQSEIISINGQLNPIVQIRPGEMQFWRLANIGATLFIKFRIEGMPLYILAIDGHPRSRPERATEFFLGPGQRLDTIAIGPQAGAYAVHTVPFQNQAWKKPDPPQELAMIVSEGAGAAGQHAEAGVLAQRVARARWFDEVRSTPIARRRTLVYSRTPDRRVFMINGRTMDENRIDETVKLGDTEEWTVVNTDQQYHSFHIHQTGFLVTEINGIRQNEDSMRDTFSMLPATDAGPSILKVVIPFTDPVIVGRFVYHCHAVDHEDKGMMGVIEVVQ